MTLHLYPEGDGAPDKNIFTNHMGAPTSLWGTNVGLVGAPTPIRLMTLKYFIWPLGPTKFHHVNNLNERLVRLETLDNFGPAPPYVYININSLVLGCGLILNSDLI